MAERTLKEVSDYVEWQCQNKCRVISAKPEHSFSDLGTEVRVWNVKTDLDGAWWVVEGDSVPMNLYPQGAYYFSADEVYSFHIGLMERMNNSFDPEGFIEAVSFNCDIAPQLLRRLKSIVTLLDSAIEVEDFQSIGVQCREVLIELGNSIYSANMAGDGEQPKASDFKRKTELFTQFYLVGSDNADYRNYIKRLSETIWDYSNKTTHSSNTTFYEVSTCVMLCTSLIGVYENIRQKVSDPIAKYKCQICESKKLKIVDDETDKDGIIRKIMLQCDECSGITEVVL